MQFFIEVLIGGLLSGVMYALVALGFVLIYKASGVFNFAQGAMVFFAALTFVGFQEVLPGWLGLAAAVWCSGWPSCWPSCHDRAGHRHRAHRAAAAGQSAPHHAVHGHHRPHLLGRGAGPDDLGRQRARPGSGHRRRADRMADGQLRDRRFQVRPVRSRCGGVLVALLALLFQYTKVGRALRAVADDHQAALSIGIPLQTIWRIVWAVAGFVALVAGMIWGARNGVQFALTFTALKALPVLILGGFTSVPGAIVGGLIIGASEKLAEVYVGPFVGGGIEGWFPYVLALAFLLVRPEGLFGEKHIDRV
jgi:branched-chain amino acid transport system permease protein